MIKKYLNKKLNIYKRYELTNNNRSKELIA